MQLLSNDNTHFSKYRFICTVPKENPIGDIEPKTRSTIKLTTKKIHWIIRQKERNESFGIISTIQHITRRRVDQLWKQYRETGIIGNSLFFRKLHFSSEEKNFYVSQLLQQHRCFSHMRARLIYWTLE